MPTNAGWNAADAVRLQRAALLSNDEFADRLRVSSRTVARWHSTPELTPRSAVQRLLDDLLNAAPPPVQARFDATTAHEPDHTPGSLRVAIAIVCRQDDVLLVRRRTDTVSNSWQFPAGVVKPEASPEAVAVRETLGETGIDCAVRQQLGARQHPATGVYCVYLLCDYLAGEPDNRDPVENESVRWVPRHSVQQFIEPDKIFPPVRAILNRSAA